MKRLNLLSKCFLAISLLIMLFIRLSGWESDILFRGLGITMLLGIFMVVFTSVKMKPNH